MPSMAMGHILTEKKVDTGEPVCQACGLVWRSSDHHPPLDCPRQPLWSICAEWVEKYT